LAQFAPKAARMRRELPDVEKIDVRFPEPTVQNSVATPLPESCDFTFVNGTVLSVPGYMLWKFRDAIPEQLGSEEHGYNDENPFSTDHGIRLMERVRTAFDTVFVEPSPPITASMFRMPVRCVVDLIKGNEHYEWRPLLSTETKAVFAPLVAWVAARQPGVSGAIKEWVRTETERPRFELGFKPGGGKWLARSEERSDWPPLNTFGFKAFLSELSERTWPETPAHMLQIDLMTQVLLQSSTDVLGRAAKLLREKHRTTFENAWGELRLGAEGARTTPKFVKSLLASDSRFMAFDELYSIWLTKLEGKSLADVLTMTEDPRAAHAESTKKSRHKPFRMVISLYVTPDFSDVTAGKLEPPWINHDKIAFSELADALAMTFKYGPHVTIRVPDDTIDMVTLSGRESQALHCRDFAEALLACASYADDRVIHIQPFWRLLHALPDRRHCAPPSLIQFVVEAYDFEDAMGWLDQSRGLLGFPYAFESLLTREKEVEQLGRLPDPLRKTLEFLFSIPFEEGCLLGKVAGDAVPRAYAKVV